MAHSVQELTIEQSEQTILKTVTDYDWQPTSYVHGESSVRLKTPAGKDQLRLTSLKWLQLLLSTLSLTAVTFSLQWFGVDGLTETQMFLPQ